MSFWGRLPALRHGHYRSFLAGSFVSNVGNQVQAWAIAWQVYDLTDSSAWVGGLGLARVVPLLVFSLFGGVVADQFDRRKVMLVTQACMAVVAGLLLISSLSQALNVFWLYGLVALGSVARAFDGPSRQSLIPSLVPPEDLPNAIGINGISWRLSDVLGPLIAGLFIGMKPLAGLSGLSLCYFLNLATFAAVLFAVFCLPARPSSQAKITSFAEVIGSIREGFQFLKETPVVRSAMFIDFWATFFSAADALLPAFAGPILRLGPQGYGLLASSGAAGALAGAVMMSLLPPVKRQGAWVIGMIALYGAGTIGFGLSFSLVAACLFQALTGFADMVSTVIRQTIRQLATPDEKRGRMSATGSIFQISGPQLGDFESGLLASFVGERASVVIGGSACLVVAGLWTRGKALRDYIHPGPASPSDRTA